MSSAQGKLRRAGAGHAWALGCCVAMTLLATPLSGRLDLTNLAMLYLAGLVGVAYHFGGGPASLSAVLNVAAFDFFFVPPRFTFAVVDAQYLVTFAVMLAVGLVIGQLTARLRSEAQVAVGREQRAQGLFELTRELSGALTADQVARHGELAVRRHFGGDALVLITNLQDGLLAPDLAPAGFEAGVACWCCANAQPAGLTTAIAAAPGWHYLPLQAPMRVRGVLAMRPAHARTLDLPEQRQHLDTLARQVAIALERVHYVDVAQKTQVQMESEGLRNTLLAAISHDLRTPLTALIGLADQLTHAQPPLREQQAETAQALADQARALNAIFTKLLDMARLQSGTIALRLQWASIEELIGTTLRSLQHRLAATRVKVELAPNLPLVEVDATLLERVLANLLENAVQYGAPPIEVSARALDGALEIEVRDHGTGLPLTQSGGEQRLFEKFTRGQHESATLGVGLGLAICKAVVEAHQGSIEASAAPGGGARFTVRLPRRASPPLPL